MTNQGSFHRRVIGIVGPTASGKTALSLMTAKRLGGEILCMDSMQTYEGMNIGTAKPTVEELAMVPHHLHSFVPPDQSFSVTQYAEAARPLVDALPVPILTGGTGLYLQALSLPMDYGTVGGDEEIRKKYHAIADTKGVQALHDLLRAVDPASAARLHPNDVRRVVRALEVFDLTGRPISKQVMPSYADGPYDFLLFGLDLDRDTLYSRIDRRVDQMIQDGLLDEVRALRDRGISQDAQSMQGLGYKELWPVLMGETPLQGAVSLIKLRTRHYAKRQLTWFRRDPRVQWLPWKPGDDLNPLAERICQAWREKEN